MRLRAQLLRSTAMVLVPGAAALVVLDGMSRHREAERVLIGITEGLVADLEAVRACDADPAAWEVGVGPFGPRRGLEGHGPARAETGPGSAGGEAPAGHAGGPGGGPGAPRPDGAGAGPAEAGAPPPPAPRGGPPPGRRGGAPPVWWAIDPSGRALGAGPEVDADLLAAARAAGAAALPAWWFEEEVRVLVAVPAAERCTFVLARGTTVPGWLGSILPAPEVWVPPVIGVLAVVLLAMGPILARIRGLSDQVQALQRSAWRSRVDVGGDDELADLARAFDDAARAVREEMAAKDQREQALREFLQDTSHDLMLPLTVLQGHLAALRAVSDAPEVVDAMGEAHYLGGMVRNLAAAARLAASPEPARDELDLAVVIERVIARHRPIARTRAISLEHAAPDAPVRIVGDLTLVEQAVSNVVYNAVRHHHPSGGHIAVVLDVDGGRFALRVIDDGPGLSDAQLSRLGDRGFRSDEARTRSPDGQGLGLSITRRVVEAHGWEVVFQRREEGGLEVVFEGEVGER